MIRLIHLYMSIYKQRVCIILFTHLLDTRSIFSLCTVSEGWGVHFARLDFDDAASQEGSVLCFLCCGQ